MLREGGVLVEECMVCRGFWWDRKLRSGRSQQCKQNAQLLSVGSDADREENTCESGLWVVGQCLCHTSRAIPRGMYQKFGEVIDCLRLTKVWRRVWVASAPSFGKYCRITTCSYNIAFSGRQELNFFLKTNHNLKTSRKLTVKTPETFQFDVRTAMPGYGGLPEGMIVL
eukprot:g20402.t1